MSSESSCNSLDCCPRDFEEELDHFFIRKESEPNADSVASSNATNVPRLIHNTFCVYDQIPLLICDVLDLDPTQFMVNGTALHAFGLPFKNCLLHARVAGRSRDNISFFKYIIDDNTASIELSIFRRQSDLEEVLRLDAEIDHFNVISAAQNKLEISKCLHRLLNKTKLQMDFSNIPIGRKILVYGKPTFFRGTVGIDAFSISNDECLAYEQEIEFKDLLIDWYTQKYSKCKLNEKT